MTKEEQEKHEKKKNTIWGDESEAMAFSNFSQLFSKEQYRSARIFSLNGIEYMFPNSEMTNEKTGEFDQIIVVDLAKIVIYVEYKRTFSASHAKRKRQFEHFRDLFEKHFPKGKGWRLVTSYGFSKWPEGDSTRRPCKNCMKYVFLIDDLPGMTAWFDRLIKEGQATFVKSFNKMENVKVDQKDDGEASH